MEDFGRYPFREAVTNMLGFPLTSEQEDWRRRAVGVGSSVLADRARQVDEGVYPEEGLRALWGEGILNMMAPLESGGGGADLLSQVLVTEALAMYCASTAMCFHMHASALYLVSRIESHGIHPDSLADILGSFRICTYATSEPGSGSHWWHMDQAAEREGDGYRIAATKSWATSAGHADYYVVPLRAGSFASPNELSLFLIPGRLPGVTPIGGWDGSGMRGNSSTPVRFDVFVPESARLGPSGQGFELLFAFGLPSFQLGLAGLYTGIAQAAYDAAGMHAVTRTYSDTGLPMAHSEVTQRQIAEMRLQLDATRSLVYIVGAQGATREGQRGDLTDAADDPGFMISLGEAKVAACEAAREVTDLALRICGGTGYKRGHAVERSYRDARAGSVMGPDDDSIKRLVGRRLLGLAFPWSEA